MYLEIFYGPNSLYGCGSLSVTWKGVGVDVFSVLR